MANCKLVSSSSACKNHTRPFRKAFVKVLLQIHESFLEGRPLALRNPRIFNHDETKIENTKKIADAFNEYGIAICTTSWSCGI